MKSIYKKFSGMDVTFREEPNELSSIMIDDSDATVITHNHSIIMRSNVLLATIHATVS